MPIDEKITLAPARNGDVAAVAIKASTGMRSLLLAIGYIKTGDEKEFRAAMEQASSIADGLAAEFNRLTGWVDD